MKTLNAVFGLTLITVLVGTLGCSTLHKSDQASLQGTWTGKEIGGRIDGTCQLVIKENELEFRGTDPWERYKGTFVLNEKAAPRQLVGTIAECPAPKYVGKTVNAIYRIENGVLTLAGHEPGNPAMPRSLDGPGAAFRASERVIQPGSSDSSADGTDERRWKTNRMCLS